MALFFSRYSGRIDFESFRKIITEEYKFSLFSSFTQLAHVYLGMPDTSLPASYKYKDLAEKILYDTLNNKYKNVGEEERMKWPFPKRKLMGAINLVNMKWKFDLVGKWEFYHRLAKKFKASF